MVNIAYSMVNPFFPSNKKPPMTTKNIKQPEDMPASKIPGLSLPIKI
jgi:hypothetical protein